MYIPVGEHIELDRELRIYSKLTMQYYFYICLWHAHSPRRCVTVLRSGLDVSYP